MFPKHKERELGCLLNANLIGDTLGPIFIIPVHGAYSVDLSNSQCLTKSKQMQSSKLNARDNSKAKPYS